MNWRAKPDNHVIDGKSFAKVLTEGHEGTGRTSVSYFPYHGGGISVREGDWKLIRHYSRRTGIYEGFFELFNLKEDLGESRNLAGEMPDKVAELSKLIETNFKQTGGLPPKSNPNFQPSAVTPARSKSPTRGLVPKQCRIESIAGAIRVIAQGKNPFLGTAQAKLEGPITLDLRARGVDGKSGKGRVQWRTQAQAKFPATGQTVDFEVPASATWQDITVRVPVEGRSDLLRLYVPASDGLDIRSIRWKGQGAKPVQWDFSTDQ